MSGHPTPTPGREGRRSTLGVLAPVLVMGLATPAAAWVAYGVRAHFSGGWFSYDRFLVPLTWTFHAAFMIAFPWVDLAFARANRARRWSGSGDVVATLLASIGTTVVLIPIPAYLLAGAYFDEDRSLGTFATVALGAVFVLASVPALVADLRLRASFRIDADVERRGEPDLRNERGAGRGRSAGRARWW